MGRRAGLRAWESVRSEAWRSQTIKRVKEAEQMKRGRAERTGMVVKRRRSNEHEWVWPGRLVTYCISWSQWFRSEAFRGAVFKSFVVDMNVKAQWTKRIDVEGMQCISKTQVMLFMLGETPIAAQASTDDPRSPSDSEMQSEIRELQFVSSLDIPKNCTRRTANHHRTTGEIEARDCFLAVRMCGPAETSCFSHIHTV